MDKKLTKNELLSKLSELLEAKEMKKIDGINQNSNRASIISAIKCLELTDAEMNDYLTVVKLKYPNIYNVVINNGNWLTHSHNRYWIYTAAKTALA